MILRQCLGGLGLGLAPLQHCSITATALRKGRCTTGQGKSVRRVRAVFYPYKPLVLELEDGGRSFHRVGHTVSNEDVATETSAEMLAEGRIKRRIGGAGAPRRK